MISRNFALKSFHTFGLDVSVEEFGCFNDLNSLQQLLENRNRNLPILLIGGGSNLLFKNSSVKATILKNEITGIELLREDENEVILKAGAGVVWHDLVQYTVENGWSGIENLSLIPGNVGASPMQNIGAYGVEIKDVFDGLEAFELETGLIKVFSKEECEFGYRESVFKRKLKDKYIILSVSYKLSKSPKNNVSYGAILDELNKMNPSSDSFSPKQISEAVIAIRQSKLPDPKLLGNAGSFFKNPVVSHNVLESIKTKYPDVPSYEQQDGSFKLAAGWLIEKAGWKGKRVGNVGMHEKQALVLVNYGGATGEELYAHSQLVMDSVFDEFHVLLEREVNIIQL